MRKAAFVSGGTRGIGRACAAILKEQGYAVIVSASSTLPDDGEFDYIRCDISKTEDRAAAMEYILKNYGRIDVLVNCAGVACKQRLDILETTEESFDRLVNINTKGTFFMCQLFANKMVEWKTAQRTIISPGSSTSAPSQLTPPASPGASTAFPRQGSA